MGIVGCELFAVGGKSVFGSRKRSIVRWTNGSMLAFASRSIARFALLEYRFAGKIGELVPGSEFRVEIGRTC